MKQWYRRKSTSYCHKLLKIIKCFKFSVNSWYTRMTIYLICYDSWKMQILESMKKLWDLGEKRHWLKPHDTRYLNRSQYNSGEYRVEVFLHIGKEWTKSYTCHFVSVYLLRWSLSVFFLGVRFHLTVFYWVRD